MQTKRKRISPEDRLRVLNRCSGHCAYCGIELSMKDMQVDHYIPLELSCIAEEHMDAVDSIDNYLPACRSCNNYKSSMNIEKFRLSVTRFHDVLMRDSVTYKNAVRFGQVKPQQHVQQFYYEKIKVHIPAMDWDADFRLMLHRSYFKEKED